MRQPSTAGEPRDPCYSRVYRPNLEPLMIKNLDSYMPRFAMALKSKYVTCDFAYNFPLLPPNSTTTTTARHRQQRQQWQQQWQRQQQHQRTTTILFGDRRDEGRETRAERWGQGLAMQMRCELQVCFFFFLSYFTCTKGHNIFMILSRL